MSHINTDNYSNDHIYGIGDRSFEIDENEIKITFSGGDDITSGKYFDEVTYTIVLDDDKAYGGYFIDIDQMLEISNIIVTKQLESGYIYDRTEIR